MTFTEAAWIIGGSAVGAGLLGAYGANKAAGQAASASDYSAQLQNQQFEETRSDQAPWRTAGGTAVNQLSAMTQPGGQLGPDSKFSYSDLYADPSYQFRLDQGLQAVQRSAAARGSLVSGGTMKGINDYAGQSASQEYGAAYGRWNNDQTNIYNRLAGIAGLGQSANSSTASAGAAAASGEGQAATAAGQAQAAGTLGVTGSISNALSGGVNNWMMMNMMNKM